MTRNDKIISKPSSLAQPRPDTISKKETDSDATARSAARPGPRRGTPEQPPKEPKDKHVFSGTLALDGLKDVECRSWSRRRRSEARRGNAEGRQWHAGRRCRSTGVRGKYDQADVEGTFSSALRTEDDGDGAADVELDLAVGRCAPALGPAKGLTLASFRRWTSRRACGRAASRRRQVAASADGRVLLTQGPGRTEGGLVGMFGGDLLRGLPGKLNPSRRRTRTPSWTAR